MINLGNCIIMTVLIQRIDSTNFQMCGLLNYVH